MGEPSSTAPVRTAPSSCDLKQSQEYVAHMNIHCLGDSITAANNLPESGRWTVRLQMLLESWKPDTYHVYTNGVGGDTTAMGMERMRRDEWDTGFTIIEFGFNDAACRAFGLKPRVSMDEYAANLKAMGLKVRERGGEPIFVINHPVNIPNEPKQPDGAFYTDKVAQYGGACRAVADKLEAPVIDLTPLMIKKRIAKEDWYLDGVHLSANGNRLYAELVFSVLQPLLERASSSTAP